MLNGSVPVFYPSNFYPSQDNNKNDDSLYITEDVYSFKCQKTKPVNSTLGVMGSEEYDLV